MLYEKVAAGIEELILSGTLAIGDKLPSVRQLSRQQRVSVPTVLQAYLILENRRLIETRPRSGYYVRERERKVELEPKSLEEYPPLMAMVADLTNPRAVPMGGANPSAKFLPRKKLARIIGAISREHPSVAINYDPVPGCPKLRMEISRRSLDWGCYIQPDEILLTHGATEALHLALATLTKPGDSVLVEDPAYYGLLNLLSHLKLRAISMRMDPATGLDVEAAREALRREKIAAIVVTPNFSNPLGSLMPEEHRRQLLDLAAQHRVPIIEDDVYGDLPHEGPRPRCLKALDEDDQVILCGTFSKTLAPGYRAGYCVPGRWMTAMAQAKHALTFGGAPLPLLAIAEFLRSGGYDHHLRTLREDFRTEVGFMREALAKALPEGSTVSNPQGGFLLWVTLPPQVDAMELFTRARAADISIAPGPLFSPNGGFRNSIRISCGNPWSPAIEAAVTTLGDLVRKQL